MTTLGGLRDSSPHFIALFQRESFRLSHSSFMGKWSLQINDPTLVAWFCVLLYSVAAVGCFRYARHETPGRTRTFWTGVAILCALLALNKQLDVHTAVLGMLGYSAAGGMVAWIVVVVFLSASGGALFLMLPALKGPSRSMLGATAALSGLAVILVGRNTVPALSSVLGFHLTSETESLLHLHVSELFELLLAGVIWLMARRPHATSINTPQVSRP